MVSVFYAFGLVLSFPLPQPDFHLATAPATLLRNSFTMSAVGPNKDWAAMLPGCQPGASMRP